MADEYDIAEVPADGVWGTIDGVPVTEDMVADMVANAEAGYPGTAFRQVGRPREIGAEPARTVTVRLDPARVSAVRRRAAAEQTSASEIMRRALDHYLAG